MPILTSDLILSLTMENWIEHYTQRNENGFSLFLKEIHVNEFEISQKQNGASKIVETFFDSPHQVLCLMWKLMDKEEKFLHYLYFHTQVKIASKRIQLAGNGSELYCMESRELENRVFLNN